LTSSNRSLVMLPELSRINTRSSSPLQSAKYTKTQACHLILIPNTVRSDNKYCLIKQQKINDNCRYAHIAPKMCTCLHVTLVRLYLQSIYDISHTHCHYCIYIIFWFVTWPEIPSNETIWTFVWKNCINAVYCKIKRHCTETCSKKPQMSLTGLIIKR